MPSPSPRCNLPVGHDAQLCGEVFGSIAFYVIVYRRFERISRGKPRFDRYRKIELALVLMIAFGMVDRRRVCAVGSAAGVKDVVVDDDEVSKCGAIPAVEIAAD